MEWLKDILLWVLFFMPWLVFIQGPLYIIQVLLSSPDNKSSVFDYLTTNALTKLIFGDFTKDPLNSKNLPHFFVALSIVAIGLILLTFVMQLIIIQFTETHSIREKLGKAIKNTFLAFIVIIFIPIFMSIINYLVTGLLEVLKVTALNGKTSLADILWGIGAGSEQMAKHKPGDFSIPSVHDLKEWNFVLEFVAIWFTLYVLFIAAMTLVERIIDLLLLFSISPIVAAMMPLDQGKRLGVWKEMVIGKFIIGPGTMLPIYLFLEILPKAIVDIGANSSGFTWLEKQLLYTLFCTAGAVSCLRTQKIINHLVTQNLGVQSAIDSNGAGIANSIVGKARGFAGLVGNAATGLKLGKEMLFGGRKDGTNPDGSPSKANGLFKNGIAGYLGKGIKGSVLGPAKFFGKWAGAARDLGGPNRRVVLGPIVAGGKKFERGIQSIGRSIGEGIDSMKKGISNSFHEGRDGKKEDND